MRRRLLLSVFLLSAFCRLEAQNIIMQPVQNGQTDVPSDDMYRINGIPMSEDLGGVDVSRGEYVGHSDRYFLDFKNYNPFPVSVIYELQDEKYGTITGSIVLLGNEAKKAMNHIIHLATSNSSLARHRLLFRIHRQFRRCKTPLSDRFA